MIMTMNTSLEMRSENFTLRVLLKDPSFSFKLNFGIVTIGTFYMIFSILSTLYFHLFPRPEHVEADLDATLKDLQTDYVDSFVIHWPMACPSTGKNVTLRTNGIYPAHQSQSNHFH